MKGKSNLVSKFRAAVVGAVSLAYCRVCDGGFSFRC